jgi:hypothetical protein
VEALNIFSGIVGYLAIALIAARVTYGRIRPSEAFTCGEKAYAPHLLDSGEWKTSEKPYNGHFTSCHRRWSKIDTRWMRAAAAQGGQRQAGAGAAQRVGLWGARPTGQT